MRISEIMWLKLSTNWTKLRLIFDSNIFGIIMIGKINKHHKVPFKMSPTDVYTLPWSRLTHFSKLLLLDRTLAISEGFVKEEEISYSMCYPMLNIVYLILLHSALIILYWWQLLLINFLFIGSIIFKGFEKINC